MTFDINNLIGLPKDVYCDIVQPAARQVGKTAELPFRAINAALSPLEKWIINKEHNIEETKKLLAKELEHVSAEKIVPPEPYVAVPALQAISYCMDCDVLRKLFAKLLATSMNQDTKNNAHPAFVEIIKQLHPIEATLLESTSLLRERHTAACKIRFQQPQDPFMLKLSLDPNFRLSTTGYDILRNFLAENASCSPETLSASIDNLIRLGLIEINYDSNIGDEAYSRFVNHPYVKVLTKSWEPYNQHQNFKDYEIALIQGVIKRTDLGQLFYQSCVSS